MKCILVATDFSIRSNNALALAKTIATHSKGEITLLHVVELPKQFHSSTGDALNTDQMANLYRLKLIERSGEELEKIKEAHSGDGVVIHTEIKSGDPYREISAFVSANDIDLVISGDKGHSEFEDLFIGSLSDKLVRMMDCPVITVKAGIVDQSISNIMFVVNAELDEEPI
ncbi:MAG: universal stress protein, partial [Cyclobacteriaceae bacterium]